ncbi:Na/Pi cotransporter family protein [Kiloniella sp. b19]|uniref:Na/Pi cotransporter family protein n=1 Tax=Kiloniella sp. GXU_MW_B19 TaxID=3141326 RepID=UPI0031E1CAE3
MAIIDFLINLFAATILLLFAVRMVQNGIEKSFGSSFKQAMTTKGTPLRSSISGLGLAMVLQSSTAVILLATGFATAGAITIASGLAIALGADLGSALVIQILSFRLEWLTPVLIALGGWLYVKTSGKQTRNAGRIILGIGFILLSLRFLRETMDPIRESAFLPAIAGYLSNDFVTAFLVGAMLAFIMHSSVATILMCVTLVAIDALPLDVGVSMVLGANLGSGLIPVWLSRGTQIEARLIPYSNLILRGSWAFITLLLVQALPIVDLISTKSAGQTLVNLHVLFNASLLLALPFCGRIEKLINSIVNGNKQPELNLKSSLSLLESAEGALSLPSEQAFTGLKRELLRMTDQVENMFRPIMVLYENGDTKSIAELQKLDDSVNDSLDDIRSFCAAFARKDLEREERKELQGYLDYAISLETAGDIIAKRLLPLAEKKLLKNIDFSREGWVELRDLHKQVSATATMASSILMNDDLESARKLVAHKSKVKKLERKSRKKHLQRLSSGDSTSFRSSDIHLETLRGLEDFNAQLSTVAYPILARNGHLLDTRLTSRDEQIARVVEM